ncbi:MAG TPA: DsbA family protein, partial [Flavobacteriales bacterium]|nr:DsbA family protein [Flavobacteriales bacterium]
MLHRSLLAAAASALFPALLCAQFLQPLPGHAASNTAHTETMTIEIWSDVVCPFCYIGKRRRSRSRWSWFPCG